MPAGIGPRVVVVTPTYNEARNLPRLVERLMALGIPGLEVLVVDDASPDGTAEVAERLGAEHGGRVRVLRRGAKLGIGSAYVAGFEEALRAGAGYVIQMDADLSHAPESIPGMLERAREADVVAGSRWVRGGGVEAGWGIGRLLLSRGGSLFARLALGLRVKDATTGFKCFRREALAGLDLRAVRSHGFAFQVEVAWACQRRGYRVVEHPIRFAKRGSGRSKMSPWIVAEALWRVAAIGLRRR